MKLDKFQRAQVPMRAGQRMGLGHIPGESVRRYKITAAPGTNPKLFGGRMKRQAGGAGQSTAPHKHQMELFNGNMAMGGPGMTEPV
jgi:hypothetical protein